MKIIVKKSLFILLTIVLLIAVAFSLLIWKPSLSASAATDGTSSAYGFTIDNEFYDVTWRNNSTKMLLKNDGKEIGQVNINIGKAVSKTKFGNSDKYLLHI